MLAFITVIGIRKHDQDGDSVIKVYRVHGSENVISWKTCTKPTGLLQKVNIGGSTVGGGVHTILRVWEGWMLGNR